MGELMAKKYPIKFVSGEIVEDYKSLQFYVQRIFDYHQQHWGEEIIANLTRDFYIPIKKAISIKKFFEGKEFTCDEMIEFLKAGVFEGMFLGSSPLLMDGETITVYDDYLE